MTLQARFFLRGALLIALLLGGTSACAPSHAGRTLGRGVLQVEGGLGGPMVTNLGPAIPIPNVPLGLRYGVMDRLDVSGHLNLLPLVTGGFMMLDASATWALYRHEGRDGWNLATSAGLALLTDFRESARLHPIFDIAGGYTYRWFTIYGGTELIVDFWANSAIANPFVGVEGAFGRFSISGAFVWFNVGHSTYASSIIYVNSDAERGSAGLMIGIKYRWDLSRHRGGDS